MLQAQIDIVDEAGHTEESVTIVGSGRVSLGTRQAGGYLHANEAEPDLPSSPRTETASGSR